MVVDYNDSQVDYEAVFNKNGKHPLVYAIRDSIKRFVEKKVIRTQRQNVNLYMSPSMISGFRSTYLASLSKRDKKKYKPFVAKNMVMIGGHWLQIRTKWQGFEVPTGDGGVKCDYVFWVKPV